MVGLRERGIYRLPNGRRLIALRDGRGSFHLYPFEAGRRAEAPVYELGERGRLYSQGILTAWDESNLADTLETAPAWEAHRLAAD